MIHNMNKDEIKKTGMRLIMYAALSFVLYILLNFIYLILI